MLLLIQLFLAHIIGDFFLQRDKWVKEKEDKKWRSYFLYVHVFIHFFLMLLATASLKFWPQALLIAVLHFIIDGLKLQMQTAKTKRTWFFVDQLLHIATIVVVGCYVEDLVFDWNALSNKELIVPLTGVLFVLNPTSIIIKAVISKWPPNAGSSDPESLQSAGKVIGMLERLLVFIFVMLGKWEGVGFLLAAKSVFRFGDLKDAKDMKLTEYVLIGTLLSFGIAILTALVVINLMHLI